MSAAGNYKGRHFTQWVEHVKTLKREGRTQEAMTLLSGLIEATEAEDRQDGFGVAPWYYEQLAILHRQGRDDAAELAVLKRYAAQRHAPGAKPAQLLARLDAVRRRVGKGQ